MPLCAALRPKPPVQVHHRHDEDVDVAVVERVDGVEDREKNISKKPHQK